MAASNLRAILGEKALALCICSHSSRKGLLDGREADCSSGRGCTFYGPSCYEAMDCLWETELPIIPEMWEQNPDVRCEAFQREDAVLADGRLAWGPRMGEQAGYCSPGLPGDSKRKSI